MNRSVQKDRVVTLPFRVVATTGISKTANTTTITELDLVPANLGTRVAAVAPCFEYYRIHKLDVQAFSSVVGPVHYDSDILNVNLGTMGGIMAVAFEPSDTTRTNVPTSLNEMLQAAEAMCGSLYDRLHYKVPRAVLLGAPLKWWNTSSTGTPTETLTQGLLWTYTYNAQTNDASVADAVHVVLQGEIQFRGMIAPANAATEKDFFESDSQSIVPVEIEDCGEQPRTGLLGPVKASPSAQLNGQHLRKQVKHPTAPIKL